MKPDKHRALAVLEFLERDRLLKEPLWRIKGSVHYDALAVGIAEVLERTSDEQTRES